MVEIGASICPQSVQHFVIVKVILVSWDLIIKVIGRAYFCAKMVITKTTKQIFQFLGYLPFENISPQVNKYLRKIPLQRLQNYATFGALAIYILQPITFIILKAKNAEEVQESIFYVGLSFAVVPSYILLVLQKSQILRLVAEFEAMVEKSM